MSTYGTRCVNFQSVWFQNTISRVIIDNETTTTTTLGERYLCNCHDQGHYVGNQKWDDDLSLNMKWGRGTREFTSAALYLYSMDRQTKMACC